MGKYTAEDNRRFAFDCRTEENGQQAIFRYQKLNGHEEWLRIEAIAAEISPRARSGAADNCCGLTKGEQVIFSSAGVCGGEAVGDCTGWKD
jgi:hypothetical protein